MILSKKKSLLILVLLLGMTKMIFASNENDEIKVNKAVTDYYLHYFHGEKSFETYSGPLSPEFILNPFENQINFLDDLFEKSYLDRQIQSQIFEIFDFWEGPFFQAFQCPNWALSQNIDYMRYLFRLVTISILYEEFKLLNRDMYRLGLNQGLCPIDFEGLFSSCAPETTDMKTFLERAKVQMDRPHNWSQYNRMTNAQVDDWIGRFSELDLDQENLSISEERLLIWCDSTQADCQKDLNKKKLQSYFAEVCKSDRSLVEKICSERDQFYGHSWQPLIKDIIKNSHSMNLLNRRGYGEACLERYVSDFDMRFNYLPTIDYLAPVFESIYNYLNARGSRHAQGALFIPGALREFDDRGLDLALFRPRQVEEPDYGPEPEPEPEPEPKPKPEPLPDIIPIIVQPRPEPEPVVVEEPTPQESYFLRAVTRFSKEGMSEYSLDMNKFKDDFNFSESMVEAISGPIQAYQTRDALLDMRTYDSLGRRAEPVRLIFLKYLIDYDQHQGLFNIVDILGERFWVLNDIDDVSEPVFIELENSQKTNFQWQIRLVVEG